MRYRQNTEHPCVVALTTDTMISLLVLTRTQNDQLPGLTLAFLLPGALCPQKARSLTAFMPLLMYHLIGKDFSEHPVQNSRRGPTSTILLTPLYFSP